MIFLTAGAFTTRAREFLDETKNVVVHKPVTVTALRAIVSDRVR
jgi:hypothetical protein